MVKDKIVLVESDDFVRSLVAEKTMSLTRDQTAEALWTFFRKAANADDAEGVLLSARGAAAVNQ